MLLREEYERYDGILTMYDPGICLKHPKVSGLGDYESHVYACLQSFVMGNVYNELYMVQLTYQQTLVDQHGVVTKHNAVRQMATPPVPRLPFSVNRELE